MAKPADRVRNEAQVGRQAMNGAVLVVAAMRAGAAVPVDIERSWRADLCGRLDLQPFDQAARRLGAAATGG